MDKKKVIKTLNEVASLLTNIPVTFANAETASRIIAGLRSIMVEVHKDESETTKTPGEAEEGSDA